MRRLVLLAMLFAVAPDVFAETSFAIRAIEVEGTRVPIEIVRAETRLVPGRSYTETEIRHAVYRIQRLPFVLAARHRLIEAEAGSHTLLITIDDMSRIEYGLEIEGSFGGRNESGGHRDTGSLGSFAGGRFFAGRTGVAEASLRGAASDDRTGASVALSYTAYDLFHSRIAGSVSLEQRGSGSGGKTLLPALAVAVPLTRSETIVATLGRTSQREEVGIGRGLKATVGPESTFAEVLWVHDTRSDAYFPRHGVRLEAGSRYGWFEFVTAAAVGNPPRVELATLDGHAHDLLFRGAAFRPLGTKNALWLNVDIARSNNVLTFPVGAERTVITNADVRAGIARNMTGVESKLSLYRVELGLAFHGNALERQHSPRSTVSEPGIFASLAHRHRWGFFRIAVTYLQGG